MTESVEIKIDLSSDHWDERYPGAKVYIDQEVIFDELIVDATQIVWNGELHDGDHKIIIEVYDKKSGDTVTDADGNIVKDVLVNVDNISIDDIDLDILMWSKSTYYPTDKDSPESVTNCTNLGWNGQWELTFSSPLYLWFLENL